MVLHLATLVLLDLVDDGDAPSTCGFVYFACMLIKNVNAAMSAPSPQKEHILKDLAQVHAKTAMRPPHSALRFAPSSRPAYATPKLADPF